MKQGDKVTVKTRKWTRTFTIAKGPEQAIDRCPNAYRELGWRTMFDIAGARGAYYGVIVYADGSVRLMGLTGNIVDGATIDCAAQGGRDED